MRQHIIFATRSFFCGRKSLVTRATILVVAGLALAAPHTAMANTIVFGAVGNLSNCIRIGPIADRSCTWSSAVDNGGLVNEASANFRGQASADDGSSILSGDASANLSARFDLPYTISRTVQVTPDPGGAIASFPTQQVVFDIEWFAAIATDSSGIGGDQRAESVDIVLSSQEFLFSDVGWYGTTSCTGDCTKYEGPIPSSIGPGSHTTTVNLSGPNAGEVSAIIPSDYRAWEDFLAPFAADYSTPFSFTQSFTGNLSIEFHLFAESSSGSFANGGEAIACAGLKSGLGSFDLDDALNCGSGLTLDASTLVVGTATEVVPEPATVLLLGFSLLGLAVVHRRTR